MARKSVAVKPDRIDIARAQRDGLVEDVGALIDQWIETPLEDFVITDRPSCDPQFR
jgi:hypothetical protein